MMHCIRGQFRISFRSVHVHRYAQGLRRKSIPNPFSVSPHLETVSQKSASITEVLRNCCLLILHHRSLAVAQTNVPGTHTSINTTQDLSELRAECMQNWMPAVITVIIHYILCVRSQRLVSEVDSWVNCFCFPPIWRKKGNAAERDTAHMTPCLLQVLNEQCRRSWS